MSRSKRQSTPENPKFSIPRHDGRKKQEIEVNVIDRLCEWHQRCTKSSSTEVKTWRQISKSDAKEKNLIQTSQGADVDGVIDIGGAFVGVEVVQYSPLSDHGAVIERDDKFRLALGTEFEPLRREIFCVDGVKLSLSVVYQQAVRTGSDTSTNRERWQVPVPTTANQQQYVKSLMRLPFADVPSWAKRTNSGFVKLEISNSVSTITDMHPIEVRSGLNFRCRTLLVPESQLSVDSLNSDPNSGASVGKCVRSILVQISEFYHPVTSSLAVGGVGLDPLWLEHTLTAKMEKSVSLYGSRVTGLDLWLLIETDSAGSRHRKIPECQWNEAVQLCNRLLSHNEHKFSRVYLIDTALRYRDEVEQDAGLLIVKPKAPLVTLVWERKLADRHDTSLSCTD